MYTLFSGQASACFDRRRTNYDHPIGEGTDTGGHRCGGKLGAGVQAASWSRAPDANWMPLESRGRLLQGVHLPGEPGHSPCCFPAMDHALGCGPVQDGVRLLQRFPSLLFVPCLNGRSDLLYRVLDPGPDRLVALSRLLALSVTLQGLLDVCQANLLLGFVLFRSRNPLPEFREKSPAP